MPLIFEGISSEVEQSLVSVLFTVASAELEGLAVLVEVGVLPITGEIELVAPGVLEPPCSAPELVELALICWLFLWTTTPTTAPIIAITTTASAMNIPACLC